MPSGMPALPSSDALLYSGMALVGGAITALIGLFGVLSSQRAPQQAALNDAFSALTKDLQEERAQLIARISELEREKSDALLTIQQRDGEIRSLQQSRDSLIAFMTRSGLSIPER